MEIYYFTFFSKVLNIGLGMTLTLTLKVKVMRSHPDLFNKKKIIDLSHTVTEILVLEVYMYYIGPIRNSKTLKAYIFLTI